MANIDLQPVEAAVAALRVKYPGFVFRTDFEPCIRGTRGIFDTHISRANDPDDAWTHSMIVPNDMATKEGYQQRVEDFLRWHAGIRE